jgi:hypothetical protein
MAATLASRRYPSLEIECQVQAGEFHASTPAVSFSRCLRYLYDAPR